MLVNHKEKVVKMALMKVGIKCDFVGFNYLVYAIDYVIDHPQSVYNIKVMFEEVAKLNNVESAQRMEANIQNAINSTYSSKGFNGINDLYGTQMIRPDHKPTVGEFIKLIAEYYIMKIYENKNNPLF